jgi:hypothetical protein
MARLKFNQILATFESILKFGQTINFQTWLKFGQTILGHKPIRPIDDWKTELKGRRKRSNDTVAPHATCLLGKVFFGRM